MRWVLVDVVVVLVALLVLAVLALQLWRAVKALGRRVATAGEQVSALTAQLEQVSVPSRAADRDVQVPVSRGPAGHRRAA